VNTGKGVGWGIIKAAIEAILARDLKKALGLLKGAQLVTFGTPGQADIQGVIAGSGRFIAIETKAAGKDAEEHQKRWGAMITAKGGLYLVADSLEVATRQLRLHGVIR